jgi:pyridoxine kinase
MAIHDISCVGRCSLTVALPIICAAGHDCGVLPTAVLSTHTGGFTDFTYRDLTADIAPISAHWQSLGLGFDAMYSGFLGSFEQIDLVAQLFKTYKTRDNIVLVDPVMADEGKLYAIYSPEMVGGMAKLCASADIIIPNITEACFMVDETYKAGPYDKPYIENLLKKLAALGPKQVVLTGIHFDDVKLGAAVYNAAGGTTEYVFAPRIEGYVHGTGDVFGSALLSALLSGFTLAEAAQIACDYVCESIRITIALDQERRYGVAFEKALPMLIKKLGLA